MELVTTEVACSEPRPVEMNKTAKAIQTSRKPFGKVSNTSTLQDYHVDKQAPNGEYITPNRESKTKQNPIERVQLKIYFQSKMTVPQKSS